ncbi:hypothetical protein NBRC111894_627 [Sporolactobacillus inulinus]|uniref:Uncharacterized protein n=1 Tax=Sporolactobacillus inulinus TaxID=2078 RepID=A0A4Y1Z7R3_9BACL|nr:hypothetical protein [Sporolactobacillus inulinus]GAY75073.1 hypothetical protein NBRC111894_627 [Sporolactobacillus inulinus]
MIPILLLTLTYVLFSNEVFQVLNVLAISTLIVMQRRFPRDGQGPIGMRPHL